MGAAIYEVLDHTNEAIVKGRLIVTAKPTIGGTLNIGSKPLSLRLGADPTKAGGLVNSLGVSTGNTVAPFDIVKVTLPGLQQPGAPVFTQWTARWKFRYMDRPVTPGGGGFTTTLTSLSEELATPYHKNYTDTDVPGYLAQGVMPFDNPIVDAIVTQHLTKHMTLAHNENDGTNYALNCQRDIRSLIDTAIGIGGVDWWWYEFDGVLEAPHFGDRFTNIVYASDASAAAAGVGRTAVVSSRPSDIPNDSRKVYNQIDLQGGSVLDEFGFPTPLMSSRSVAGGTYGTTALGVIPAPPFSDPTIMDQPTLDKRGDSLLARHQILEQTMTLRLIMDASAGDGYAEGMIRPGNKLKIREDDGSFTGPYYVVDWDIEEWTDPTKTIQVVQVASTFGDYHGNVASPAAQGLYAGQFMSLGQAGTGIDWSDVRPDSLVMHVLHSATIAANGFASSAFLHLDEAGLVSLAGAAASGSAVSIAASNGGVVITVDNATYGIILDALGGGPIQLLSPHLDLGSAGYLLTSHGGNQFRVAVDDSGVLFTTPEP
jgi:hypothetical protein